MKSLALRLYQEFNPGSPLRSPRPKYLVKPDQNNYGLRWFDKKRYQDILDLIAIDGQEVLFKFMFPKTRSTIRYFRDVFNTQDTHHLDRFYVFAICNQKDEVIGWIQYMVDGYRTKLKKIANLSGKPLILEVSYAKFFNPENKHVAVNGLKNSIDIIKKIDHNDSGEIYLSGYTDPANPASESVLKANGFEKLSQQMLYINEVSNIWIKKIN
jgi:RimJ/RimL family protein N-acetyltransferase